ncbi:MAG: hypothetical protein QY323_03180 [Patescibacteria group bacterium]|nr:MAG: hypothetical protein QY323_03180 [Patescibacteria group bacterium]
MNPLSGKAVPAKPIAGLAVILFIATVIGGWLYVDNMRGELEAMILDAGSSSDQTRKVVGEVSEKVGLLEEGQIGAGAARVHRLGEYMFEVDPELTLDRYDRSSGLLMNGAQAVAQFTCPAPDVFAFEEWEFKNKEKNISGPGGSIRVVLGEGTPTPGSDAKELSYILIQPDSPSLAKTGFNCVIVSQDPQQNVLKVMREIYDTLLYFPI